MSLQAHDRVSRLGLCFIWAGYDEAYPVRASRQGRGVIHRNSLFPEGFEFRALRLNGAALLGLEPPLNRCGSIRLDRP